jgi:hypothetical protein
MARLRRQPRANLSSLTLNQTMALVLGPSAGRRAGWSGFGSEAALWAAWRLHRVELLGDGPCWASRAYKDKSLRVEDPAWAGEARKIVTLTERRAPADPVSDPGDVD